MDVFLFHAFPKHLLGQHGYICIPQRCLPDDLLGSHKGQYQHSPDIGMIF